MADYYQLLFFSNEYYSPSKKPPTPVLILKSSCHHLCFDTNGIFHRPNDNMVHKMMTANCCINLPDPFSYNFLYFSTEQRNELRTSELQLQNYLNDILQKEIKITDVGSEGLFPMISAIHSGSTLTLYHFVDLSYQGGLSISFYSEEYQTILEDTEVFNEIVDVFFNSYRQLLTFRAQLNDNCWYTKWKPNYEIERKYTFTEELPDTWALINRLYQQIICGKLKGFVPELDKEFQVFDYESHIYEVLSPKEQKGYISFIPQSDGLMTIKQKRFEQNSEIRKETVTWNNKLSLENSQEQAVKMIGKGELRRLPTFRRKRFDVNFESLKTGNIFGIYLDICRVTEPGYHGAFGQCEVEYCRSRTLWPIQDVMREYENVCTFTKKFLLKESVSFEQNLFSKLDFVRQIYEKNNETVFTTL